jgi:threonine aldolase
MASRLAGAVRDLPGLEIVYPVEANAVFVRIPRKVIDALLEELPGEPPFHIWDEHANVVRWMCAWDTTTEDVDEFAAAVEGVLR